MIKPNRNYDFVVIGSGPAGQKAAIQAAKCGKRTAIIERERCVGGACVHHGTIPSKTLRESAEQMSRMQRYAKIFDFKLREDIQVRTLVERMETVIGAHVEYMGSQLDRNEIDRIHGRAAFEGPNEIAVTAPSGEVTMLRSEHVIIATGSRPRHPDNIAIDHEHILDSDSILSMLYLPQSLTILGGGVIGSEYASIFACLGVKVTLIDRAPRPVRFMDKDLTDSFLEHFVAHGGVFLGDQTVEGVEWDGVSQVVTHLANGATVMSDKLLVSMGRIANVETLGIDRAGVEMNGTGRVPIDEFCRTSASHIYAVGDVAGYPGLASSAMEQGRRAARHALGVPTGRSFEMVPIGIYSVPEMASIGLTEEAAIEKHGSAVVGRARFSEVARGLVSGVENGVLKIVACPKGEKLLGVHILGDDATELIHVGQMALITESDVDIFIEEIFNFPTLAEAYRVAALDVVNQRG